MGGYKKYKVLNIEPLGYSSHAKNMIQEFADYFEGSWGDIGNNPVTAEINVLIVRLSRFIGASELDIFPSLEYIVTATTGLDHIDFKETEKRGIKVISLRGETAFLNTIPSTAEHTWALLMALIRNIPAANEHVRTGGWNRDNFRGYQLKDKTIGIIGLGRIGSKVAEYAQAFGMKVIYFDPYVQNQEFEKQTTLEMLLERSDILTVHVHLTDDTYHLLNTENLKKCKKGTFIVNTSRGKIVNERTLCELLKKGVITGIAVDVLETELDQIKESALWKAQSEGFNIIITPHIAGATWDAMHACEEFMVKKIWKNVSI